MQFAKWTIFTVLWTIGSGQDEFPNPDTQNYQYHYYVRDENTGDVKSHKERKIGDNVSGEYTVGDPNGDLRVVTYTADEGGFRANVKYEEGGAPLSAIVDKERQTNSQSGYEFQWLPGDQVDQTPEKTATDGGDSAEAKASQEVGSTEGSNDSEGTSEASLQPEVSTPGTTASEETTSGNGNGDAPPEEKQEEKASSEEATGSNGNVELASPEKDSSEEKEASGENAASEEKESEPKEESAEAAESAPQSEEVAAATEPGQMYLPVLPFQNAPYYIPPESQARENERPTIIYASQNFYNPWQWFGVTKRVEREDQPSTGQPAGHYMTGLGYIIVPPRPDE